MEANSTPPGPNTVTVRRNPHRRARPTPATPALKIRPFPLSPPQISHFPHSDFLSIPQNPNPDTPENLRVFLRIRPQIENKVIKADKKNAWPQRSRTKNETSKMKKAKSEICVSINDDHSVSLCPPRSLVEMKRAKTEVFEGFSHVFSADSSQVEVFDKMVKPLVDEFLGGKSGMLAALGPSGSGKTHTVFGSPREPGMVPQALGQIFSKNGVHKTQSSRTFYISMFEICSERGKAERLCDLLQNGGDLCLQQSAIKGLQEVLISDVQQAECFIARGMLKRATATTNSNSQSSRSQCVINIRTVESKIDKEVDGQFNCAVLTIVDLAGAEREKKTGNQGARLLESNFINNTSMVFGQCLRSLLEHQKNPKKPLQKHFQGSLLTRYLREYLEGKKRMALILTVRSGEEDYLDSSLLLRQASPYMNIKFNNIEESINLLHTKRQKQPLPRIEQRKRMKFTPEESVNNNDKKVADQLQEDRQKRSNTIMQNFAKAMWNVLKEYKANLAMAENQIKNLKESLAEEKARRLELEIELEDLKGHQSCPKENCTVNEDSSFANGSCEQIECHLIDNVPDSVSWNSSSSSFDDSECPGQSYQVSRRILPGENDTCFELEKYLKDVKGPHSCQVIENLIPGKSESLADENIRCYELDIEVKDEEGPLSCSKGTSWVNKDIFFGHKSTEKDGYLGTDDVRNLELLHDSGSVVDNSESQGKSYQCEFTDKKSKSFLGQVDSSEESKDLTDAGKDDNQFNASVYSQPLLSSPETLTITKENNYHSTEKKERHDDQYKVAKSQIQNDRESYADENSRCSELEIDVKDVQGALSCRKGTSSVNEGSFLGSKSSKQEGCQESVDVRDSKPCSVSSSAVENYESQGQSYQYQFNDKECGSFLGEVDGSEALKDLTDTASGHSQPLASCPEMLTITKDNINHSAEKNKRHDEEYKVAKNQFQNARERHADEDARHYELKLEVKDVWVPPSCRNGTCLVNKDNVLDSKSEKQEGFQEFDDVHDSESCGASSSVVDHTESQGKSCQYQFSDKGRGGFLGKVDSSEASKDLTDTVSGHSQPLMSVPETPTITKENLCPSAEKKKRHDEEHKEHPHRSMKTKEAKFHLGCDDNALKSENKSRFPCKPTNAEKPKRRLVPASSVLLRDLGGFNFEDEKEKPKDNKGDKRSDPLERKITEGSSLLLRLLNNNLY